MIGNGIVIYIKNSSGCKILLGIRVRRYRILAITRILAENNKIVGNIGIP